ncbi:ribonuclease H family protein [Lactobacillus pasteurii]|uniref:ribonuclease H n=1 Tax=Lactobacillus pasteurii DSM 23907 = CRBIP 24.76 TaxID=1423790 RepID=I7LET3_9LACO|nr:hypothetical protein C5L33_000196 [Lactobacillus pasteurii]CCI86058.1 Ribonuclease H1 [Lactobacillus pasteurii DSM 23907 = CRBIP 24.76]
MADQYYATIYTDGGTRNSGAGIKGAKVAASDPAAWAYLIEYNGQEVHEAGGRPGQTNNQMELTGFIAALRKLIELDINQEKLLFVLDSKYVLDPINQHWLEGWKKRGWKRAAGPLKNKELWQEVDHLLPEFPNATFSWTKGHEGNAGNEFVDGLLNQFMDQHM